MKYNFRMTNILIVGSLNADLVVRTPRFPKPGETISGEDLQVIPGGKGAKLGRGIEILQQIFHLQTAREG